MGKWSVRALLLVGTMSAMALSGFSPASATTPDEGCFVAAINSARASAGLGSLSVDGSLTTIAEGWTQNMATAGTISHNMNLPNVAPSDWMNLGENVGEGPSCAAIAQAFMNSPEHKANILDTQYSMVGVGVVIAADGTMFVTEDFMGTGATTAPVPAPVHTTPPPPAPAPVHTTPPVPAPVHTTPPVAAPVHTTPPAPKVVAAPVEPAPPASPAPVAPAPSPSPAPVIAPVPSAVPVVLAAEPVAQPLHGPAFAPAGGHKPHQGGLLHSVVSSIGSLLGHIF